MSQSGDRQILDQFTAELGKPVAPDRTRQASDRVLDSLSALYEDRSVRPAFTIVHAHDRQLGRSPNLLPAMAATLLVVAVMLVGALSMPDGMSVLAHNSKGGSIRAGEIVRTAEKSSVLTLKDGSRVELGRAVELSLYRAVDGLRIDLNRGNVIVTAAKQHNGHLYVQTRDCLVTVVGTVFSVKAEESGSRVAVLEGKVHVEHGNVSQTLLPGQQVATNPDMPIIPLQKEIEWSSDALAQMALLQQPGGQPPAAPAPQNPDDEKLRQGGDGIIKNKTFFFQLWDQQQVNGKSAILTDAARAGIFRYFTNWSTRSGAALLVQPIAIDAEALLRYIPISDPGSTASISSIVFSGIRGREVSFANDKGDIWSYGCADCTFTVSNTGVAGNTAGATSGLSFKLNPDGSVLTATCHSTQCSITTVRPTGLTGWQQPSEIRWDVKNLTGGSEVNIPAGELLPLPVEPSTGPAANKLAYIFSFAK